jgi:hypothetical protein
MNDSLLPTPTPPANVQEWTVNGPVPMPCHDCGQPASYWANNAVWMCAEHWEIFYQGCLKVTPVFKFAPLGPAPADVPKNATTPSDQSLPQS